MTLASVVVVHIPEALGLWKRPPKIHVSLQLPVLHTLLRPSGSVNTYMRKLSFLCRSFLPAAAFVAAAAATTYYSAAAAAAAAAAVATATATTTTTAIGVFLSFITTSTATTH